MTVLVEAEDADLEYDFFFLFFLFFDSRRRK